MSPTTRVTRGRAALAAAAGAGLVASTMALTSAPAHAAEPVAIQIIGTNDFHGRLIVDRTVGAAKYAGVVEGLRAENPNTLFAAAGDLIGATTFESFIAQDKPTIDVFNQMGLDVSAVGNHELDQGYSDLVDRVMAPYDATTNPKGGAEWPYIAANLDEPGDADEIAPSWTTDVAGVTVGFVGAITEDLPSLVSAQGIQGLTVTDIVAATNEEAGELTAAGADLVVLLVHEGSSTTDCDTMRDGAFGPVIDGVDGNVDAIISGHTHEDYSCAFPVPDWAADPAHVVKDRPVVSAGQYGDFLDKLVFTVEPDAGTVLGVTHELIDVGDSEFAADPDVQAIVDQAVADSAEPGSVELGEIGGPFKRATKADGGENRGGESTLGNFVAEVQRWATDAQIGFMNPGGLRADMIGNADAGYPAPVTYRQAAVVQPYANTLVTIDLTGAQIRQLLEEQVQPEGASRPFFRMGVSKGFKYTYDPAAEPGQRVGPMFLNGSKVKAGETYQVSANSFLASGVGDNFFTFGEGTNKQDTGKTDLQAMVDYLAAHDAVPVDWKQRAVGLHWLSDNVSEPGSRKVKIDVSSLAFTGAGDLQDGKIIARIGKQVLGKFAVDNTLPPLEDPLSAFDETGATKVVVRVAKDLGPGKVWLKLVGNKTGTTVKVPVRIKK